MVQRQQAGLVHDPQGDPARLQVANSPVNIYTRTPPELTYAHPAVVEMFGHMRLVALGALALLIVIAGFIQMASPAMGIDLPLLGAVNYPG